MQMMKCPKCGIDNSVRRGTCYICAAPLHPGPAPPATTHPTNPDQAPPQRLTLSASVVIRDLDAEARADLADLDRWPMAQIVEVLDDRTCPLCRYMDGMVLDRRMPEFDKWVLPPHINCRRTVAYVAGDEMELGPDGKPRPIGPDFIEPPRDLIEKYGHFITNPEKDAALRVMAQPEGRDFIFARVKDADTGIITPTLFWRCEPVDLPGLDPGVCHVRPEQWMNDVDLRRQVEKL